MPNTTDLANKLREVQTQIILLAEGMRQLADLLDATSELTAETPRILSEAQFAAFLGTSVAALRTRRFRKQIPEAIWIKEGRRTLYSIEAYEQWIQKQMQSSLVPVPSQQQKARKSKAFSKHGQGKRPYPLLV